MRIVLDTNVLVSALITDGKSRALLERLLGPDDDLIISQQIIDEFLAVTSEQRLAKDIHDDDLVRFLRVLLSWAYPAKVRSRFKVLGGPDDEILRTARDGRADVIVSGDSHLLDLKEFRGIRITTVAGILEELQNEQGRSG